MTDTVYIVRISGDITVFDDKDVAEAYAEPWKNAVVYERNVIEYDVAINDRLINEGDV